MFPHAKKCHMLAVLLAVPLLLALPDRGPIKVSESHAEAVVQAIEDEIYDYNYQGQFDVLHKYNEPDFVRLRVYISPEFQKATLADGSEYHFAFVMYKLMPHGEVIREFYIRDDELAILGGDPWLGFPPTGPNLKTVYLDDEDVIEWKLSWHKYYFTVLFDPPPERIKQAVERQKERYGFSFKEEGNSPTALKNRKKESAR